MDGKKVKTVEVAAEAENPQVYEVKLLECRARGGLPSHSSTISMTSRPRIPKRRDRNLIVDYLEIQGTAAAANAPLPSRIGESSSRRRRKQRRTRVVRTILERFASRAYRRPITPGSSARLIKFVDLAEQSGDSFERGIQLAVEAVLVSSQFLFRVEIDPRVSRRATRKPRHGRIRSTSSSCASRLSYFLYSSIPDDELWQLAVAGKLREGDNLEKQVRRMLRDPRRRPSSRTSRTSGSRSATSRR